MIKTSEKKKAKKSLGQNFLKDKTAIFKMIDGLNISKDDYLIEIGGGRGALTEYVVENKDYSKFDVYEIDKDLRSGLNSILGNDSRNELKFENFLDADLNIDKYKIIGSLPYYITSPIIHKILRQKKRPDVCVFLVQKEVGYKLIDGAPRASYWSYITLGYDVSKVIVVKASSFDPAPKVDSMIVKFVRNSEQEKLFNELDFKKWEKFLHHAYKNPRKMINKTFDKELLNRLEIDSNLRPQNLELADIIKLYKNHYEIN